MPYESDNMNVSMIDSLLWFGMGSLKGPIVLSFERQKFIYLPTAQLKLPVRSGLRHLNHLSTLPSISRAAVLYLMLHERIVRQTYFSLKKQTFLQARSLSNPIASLLKYYSFYK